MSKYGILRIDFHDPLSIGRKRRKLNILYGIISFVFLCIYLVLYTIFEIGFLLSYFPVVILITLFYLYFFLKLKKENNRIMTIGNVEFKRTGLIKRIGDLTTEISYGNLNLIQLDKHIPALKATDSKSGFMSYILTLHFNDFHIEKLIVSDRPVGKHIDLSVTETVKTLKKIKAVEVVIN